MKQLILVAIVAAAIIFGIGKYLAPDDLKGCGFEPSETCQSADAIIAISGGDTSARTKEAINLYQNGWADKLVFSGAALDKSGPSNAAAMKKIAIESGIPKEAILIEEQSETTRENATNIGQILQNQDVVSVILVTSGYHQRRAELEFGDRLGSNIEIINHPVVSDNQWSSQLWWLTYEGWYLALSELVKIAAFYLGGSK